MIMFLAIGVDALFVFSTMTAVYGGKTRSEPSCSFRFGLKGWFRPFDSSGLSTPNNDSIVNISFTDDIFDRQIVKKVKEGMSVSKRHWQRAE